MKHVFEFERRIILVLLVFSVSCCQHVEAAFTRKPDSHVGYMATLAELQTQPANLTDSLTESAGNLRKASLESAKNLHSVSRTVAGYDNQPSSLEVKCFTNTVANSSSNPLQRCPEECPYLAHDRFSPVHCSFQCVTADMCAVMEPEKPIACPKHGVCRAADCKFCKKPMVDGTDRCMECDWGFVLNAEGQCTSQFKSCIVALVLVLGIAMILLVCWVVDLARRPVINAEALAEGLSFREESKNRDGLGNIVELDVNLCRSKRVTNVAGPGITLFFNYQAAVIIWAFLMALGWLLLSVFVDPVLAKLGTRPFGTPRDNCILVAWGYENQQKFMWAKVYFLWYAYISTFILGLFHSVRQLRKFEKWDSAHKTMKDFAVLIVGLPELDGNEHVEVQLKRGFEEQFRIGLCGVSIAWNFKENFDEVNNAIKVQHFRDSGLERVQTPWATPARSALNKMEIFLACPHISPSEKSDEQVKEILTSMKTSTNAFLVFHTEAEKDLAFQKVNQKGFLFGGNTLRCEKFECEPQSVLWENFDRKKFSDIVWNISMACGSIILAMVAWTLVFYAPYAWLVYNFNYDNGQRPGLLYESLFSVVVIIGNNIMYYVCLKVSRDIGFRFNFHKETSYMILYSGACTLNLALDVVTTYYQSWYIIQGLGFHTYDGQPISRVTMFPEGFETYAMQRMMAENIFAYAFPATFLLPFLAEPFVTTILPLQLAKFFVRSHLEINDDEAQELLTAAPMDLIRYGDIQLNVVIFILMFSFPGGYTVKLGLLMILCHILIYMWDHYRVLRVVPRCFFASMSTDWWSQAMLVPCCGLILSIVVFKICSVEGKEHTTSRCVVAFLLHCIVHMLLLVYAVPCFSKRHEDVDVNATYEDLAETIPVNWFNTNPVHCLRSRYVYKENPPCIFVDQEIRGQCQRSYAIKMRHSTKSLPEL